MKTLEALGYNYYEIKAGHVCVTQKDCDWIMDNQIETYRTISWKYLTSPCGCANAVLTDMTYSNRAALDTEDFEKFMNAVKYEQYDEAADELYKTEWCLNWGKRCQRDAEQIRGYCATPTKEFL